MASQNSAAVYFIKGQEISPGNRIQKKLTKRNVDIHRATLIIQRLVFLVVVRLAECKSY